MGGPKEKAPALAEAFPVTLHARSVDVGSADVHGTRTIFGEDGLEAASADIERRAEVAMAPVTMSMMTMMAMTMMTVTVMAMMTVVATMLAAGGRR